MSNLNTLNKWVSMNICLVTKDKKYEFSPLFIWVCVIYYASRVSGQLSVVSQCGLGEPLRCGGSPRCRKWRGFPHKQLTFPEGVLVRCSAEPFSQSKRSRRVEYPKGQLFFFGKSLIAHPKGGWFLQIFDTDHCTGGFTNMLTDQ
jgi:hypothetical protein